MAIKIINDTGMGIGTKIITETDVDICSLLGVESIRLEMSAGNINRATMVLGVVETEVVVDHAEWLTKNPCSNKFEKISSITFACGDKIVFDENGEVVVYNNGGIVELESLSDGHKEKFKAASVYKKGGL